MAIQEINNYHHVDYQKKMDKDEKVVRKALSKIWVQILEKYAQPGAFIPTEDQVRQELIDEGVYAAVEALYHAHWFVFDWMVEDKVKKIIEENLNAFDLASFIEDVREAQENPSLLEEIREKVKDYLLHPKH